MNHSPAPHSPLIALALQWRALGMLAVAIGRQISLASKMRSNAGLHQAELLEAWLYAATLQIARQISDYSNRGAPTCPEEARALEYLKTVYTYLSILTLWTAQMRRDLAGITGAWPGAAHRPHICWSAPAREAEPPFLDSS